MNLPRRFFVVPHTHWDREWYRPFEHFRLWLGRVVDGVIDTLERDPAFSSFTLDGQAIVLEDYLDVRPENEGRLRALLKDGRLEVGPSYILPDEFLVGSEPLVRNLLIGREVCQRFGVAPSPVGYMPDSFGHPLQLPQILRGFGLGSFIFSRGMGDQLDEVGVVFRWRAPDGSAVLAFQQLPHYGNFARVAGADDAEARVAGIVERFGPALDRAGVNEVLLCNGSDHLPIQPELPALCDELGRRFPGGRVHDLELRATTSTRSARSTCRRGAASCWGAGSRTCCAASIRHGSTSSVQTSVPSGGCSTVETLAALHALVSGEACPSADFSLAWRELLRNHPHDSICGCSCDEVHRDMLVRYESLERTVWQLGYCAFERLGAREAEGRATVFNPLPEARSGLVEVAGAEPQLVRAGGVRGANRRAEPAERDRGPRRQLDRERPAIAARRRPTAR